MKEWIGNHGYIVNKNGLKHRQIAGAKPGEVVHHKDGNKMNNSPENLEVFPSQSVHAKLHGLSFYQGGKGKVWMNKNKNPEMKCWEVRIMFNGHRKRLGLYEDPLTAQLVYDLVWEELNAI